MGRVLATKTDSLSLVPRPHTAVVVPGGAPGEESSVCLGPFLSLPPSLDKGWNGPLALGLNWAKAQEICTAPEKAAATSGLGRTSLYISRP